MIGLAVALLAAAAPAGEIKIHKWPCALVPQEVVTIPVVMDIGYWVHIINQDAKIKLKQISIETYEGCTDLRLRSNFDLTLMCSIVPTGIIKGNYSCFVEGADIDAPGGTATVCARLTQANLVGAPGGSRNVQVANVVVRVVPRF
jgi:hypothetical protein